MRPHHERAIQKQVERFEQDETCLAIIVGGSIAKGMEREDSDVDVMLVVTDDVYREKWEKNQLCYFSVEFCDYAGGYIDGKFINIDYLKEAAERGNEVTRSSFNGTFVAFSRVPEVEELIRRIPAYQSQERRQKIQSFYAQIEIAYWFTTEARKRNDNYMLHRAVADLVFFGSRLILAHNEVLFPYHKFLMAELAKAPEKPEGLMGLIDALLEEHSDENAKAFYEAVKNFRFWNEAMEFPAVRFMKDVELAWLTRTPYIGDA